MGEAAPARLDVITRHRLGLLGLQADEVIEAPLDKRLRATYAAFLERVPYENLSDDRACREHPNEPDTWPRLEADIRAQHVPADVELTADSDYGTRYEIAAPLTGPSGRTVVFRSVWQIDLGSDRPRLITMYPG